MLFFLLKEGDLQLPAITAGDVASYWNTPWHLPLAGALERLIAITLHITLSAMVWLSVRNRSWGWMVGAILLHALFNVLAVLLLQTFQWSAWGIEGILLILSALCLSLLYWIYHRYVNPLRSSMDHTAK